MELRSLLALLLAVDASAFAPGVAPLRTQHAVVSGIRMAGWQDQYSGNAFKSGKEKKLKTGKTSFDEEMAKTGNAINGPLAIFSVVTGVIIIGVLGFLLQGTA